MNSPVKIGFAEWGLVPRFFRESMSPVDRDSVLSFRGRRILGRLPTGGRYEILSGG